MDNNKKNLIYEINYICISCNNIYQSFSTINNEFRIESCSNCNSFYNKENSSNFKIGIIEKFYNRNKKFEK